jgi:hypothetical protein
MILLGRHLGAPASGACAIALDFAFSGFWTGHAEHTSTLYTISWLPSIVWRLAEDRGADAKVALAAFKGPVAPGPNGDAASLCGTFTYAPSATQPRG